MSLPDRPEHRAYLSKVGVNLELTVLAGLEFIGWDNCINKNSKVFIKPNLTFPRYKPGISTTPELLKHLLKLLRSKADKVILGESDGGNNSFTADEAFDGHDMRQICEEAGVELVNLSKLPSEIIEDKIAGKKVRVRLPRLLLEEIDCIISVPVLKVHAMTGVTLSMKNLWGCHPDPMRCLEHQNLSRKLALIARTLKPAIIVVDGIYALDGHGPLFGVPRKTDLIMVADNPVAADSLGAAIMGIPLKRANHILYAEKTGVGSSSVKNIGTNEDWEQYKMQFSVRRTLVDRATSLLFNSDIIARLVMKSPLTPLIYKVAATLRSPEEEELADDIGKSKIVGPY